MSIINYSDEKRLKLLEMEYKILTLKTSLEIQEAK